MIKQVNIINDLGQRLELELSSPEKSGLIVSNIDGIGPETANIAMDQSSNMDGGTYNSSKKPPRNIVFQLKFYDLPSIETNRHKTYEYFPLKKKIEMEFITDKRRASISGRVESNSPDIFSKQEGCQISILCEDPNFYKMYGESIYNSSEFSSTVPLFYFPFIEEPLENPYDLTRYFFIFGDVQTGSANAIIRNIGDEDCGCRIKISNIEPGTYSNIRISNITTNEEFIFRTLTIASKLEEITINSFPGNKEVYIYNPNTGISANIMNWKDPSSNWISLRRGENLLYCSLYSIGLSDNPFVEFEYPCIYGGI